MNANATTAAPRALQGSLLRVALRLDAVVTGANGLGYLVLADVLDGTLGLPAGMLRGIGAFLLAFAVAVWLVARPATISRGAAAVVVAANVLWVIDSLALVAFDWGTPTTAGAVWAVLQAGVVALFAALQVAGLRR